MFDDLGEVDDGVCDFGSEDVVGVVGGVVGELVVGVVVEVVVGDWYVTEKTV